MQLFVTDYQKKDNTVIINNLELLSQIRKVLRASIGDIIWIQSPKHELKKTRYELRIEVRDNQTLEWTILSEQLHESTPEQTKMIVAMPNKWEKAELIVQKLTEIGINTIIFWPSERSVIKEWNSKKEERIQKIIKEAVEQSRGRTIPELHFTTDITKYLQDSELIIFDRNIKDEELRIKNWTSKVQRLKSKVWIVGPEWWLTLRDYKQFESHKPKIIHLWETVLRMETAAIIGWRLLKNN